MLKTQVNNGLLYYVLGFVLIQILFMIAESIIPSASVIQYVIILFLTSLYNLFLNPFMLFCAELIFRNKQVINNKQIIKNILITYIVIFIVMLYDSEIISLWFQSFEKNLIILFFVIGIIFQSLLFFIFIKKKENTFLNYFLILLPAIPIWIGMIPVIILGVAFIGYTP